MAFGLLGLITLARAYCVCLDFNFVSSNIIACHCDLKVSLRNLNICIMTILYLGKGTSHLNIILEESWLTTPQKAPKYL